MAERADVVVLGLGPGGEEVAGRLAEAGVDVVGVESRLVGGECPYWGCVPSKMMIRAANALAEARRVDELAGRARVDPDWAPVARRIRDEATDNWDDTVAVDRLVKKGGRFVRGRGRLAGPDRVVVDRGDETDIEIEVARGVVVATGTVPVIPPIPGLDAVAAWTNHEAIEVEVLPASIVVLGGGAIGLELAQVFNRFGVTTTVVEGADRLLVNEEPEVGERIAAALRAEGVEVHTSVKAIAARRDGADTVITLESGVELRAAQLLVAVGRRAELGALGLDTVGLDPQASAITVDNHLRAGPKLWAVGDITGHGAFTHVAVYQGRIATADILGQPGAPATYGALPRVTFTDPEVGSVGVTEEQALAAGVHVRTASSDVAKSARGWIHRGTGLIKLVVDADRDVLVGATSMGPVGGEVLSMLTLAIHAKTPIDALRGMIYAYPTFHRGVEDALHRLDRS